MSDRTLPLADIERVRAHRWRTAPSRRIADERGALRFIRELGFVLLMPVQGAGFPSISRAAPADWSWWDWKQTLPARKACYYAKLIRRRGTFVSWQWFPVFLAALGDPRPYHHLYRDGLLDRDEKQILDLLADRGPLMTREVRLAFGPRSRRNTRRVKSILVDLQTRFLITAAGGDTSGWSHHRWDLVGRWVRADLLAESRRMAQADARTRLAAKFVEDVAAATPADIAWAFGWERAEVAPMVKRLVRAGRLATALVPELEGEVLVPNPWPRLPRGRPR